MSTFCDKDSWFGVQDPKKRKQIQDRLAQRARRKRLADSSKNVNTTANKTLDESSSLNNPNLQITGPQIVDLDETNSSPSIFSCSSQSIPAVDELTNLSAFSVTQDVEFLKPPLTVYTALWINGTLLGIACTCGPSRSEPVEAGLVPSSLQPTQLQLSSIHKRFIDRLPFPRMRDNMITLDGLVDLEEFLADLFTIESFWLIPGGSSWDPKAWRVKKEFHDRWGYLFC